MPIGGNKQGGLAGQVVVLGGAVSQELEDGVGARGVVVILVLVPGQEAGDAGPDHLQKRVLGQIGVAGVVWGAGVGLGQPDALVERADGKQTGITGRLTRRRLDDERRPEEFQDLWPGGWYNHRLPPGLRIGCDPRSFWCAR
jgi:hypothetical protein